MLVMLGTKIGMLATLYATFSILCGDCGTWELQSLLVQNFNFRNNKNEIKRGKEKVLLKERKLFILSLSAVIFDAFTALLLIFINM